MCWCFIEKKMLYLTVKYLFNFHILLKMISYHSKRKYSNSQNSSLQINQPSFTANIIFLYVLIILTYLQTVDR